MEGSVHIDSPLRNVGSAALYGLGTVLRKASLSFSLQLQPFHMLVTVPIMRWFS